jgi:glucose/mannose transport system permease protein
VTRALALWACLALAGLAFVLPLYAILVTAFKPLGEVVRGSILALPDHWTVEPLLRAWSTACIGADCHGLRGGFVNSLRIAVPASCLSVLLGAINGYALTLWRPPGVHLLFGLLLAANFIPYQMVLLPMALLLGRLGLFGTAEGLILVHAAFGMPYVTLLFRNFYLGIPDRLIHAARIDGGRFWTIFGHVVLPLSAPMVAVALMLQFSAIWNDYLFALVFGGSAAPITVPLENLINAGLGGQEYNVDMAGILLTALPTLAVYLFAGHWFLRGLRAGAAR